MHCPTDGTELAITDRQGIEIDYCPKCRGVWLDRGELDKLIERSNMATPPPREQYSSRDNDERRYSHDDDDDHRHGHDHDKKKKKEGFLGDMFDF